MSKYPQWRSFNTSQIPGVDTVRGSLKTIKKSLNKIDKVLKKVQNVLSVIKGLVGLLQQFEALMQDMLWAFIKVITDQILQWLNDAKSTGVYFLDCFSYHLDVKALNGEGDLFTYGDAWWSEFVPNTNGKGAPSHENLLDKIHESYQLWKLESYNEFINRIVDSFLDTSDKPSKELFNIINGAAGGSLTSFLKQYNGNEGSGRGYIPDLKVPALFQRTGRPQFSENSYVKVAMVAFCTPAYEWDKLFKIINSVSTFFGGIIDIPLDVLNIISQIEGLSDKSKDDIINWVDDFSSRLEENINMMAWQGPAREPNFYGLNIYQILQPYFDYLESLLNSLQQSSFRVEHDLFDTILGIINRLEKEIEEIRNIIKTIIDFIDFLEVILTLTNFSVLTFDTHYGIDGVIDNLENSTGFYETKFLFDDIYRILKDNSRKLSEFSTSPATKSEIKDIVFDILGNDTTSEPRIRKNIHYGKKKIDKERVKTETKVKNSTILLGDYQRRADDSIVISNNIDSYLNAVKTDVSLIDLDFIYESAIEPIDINVIESKEEYDGAKSEINSEFWINAQIDIANGKLDDSKVPLSVLYDELNNSIITISELDSLSPTYDTDLDTAETIRDSIQFKINEYEASWIEKRDLYNEVKSILILKNPISDSDIDDLESIYTSDSTDVNYTAWKAAIVKKDVDDKLDAYNSFVSQKELLTAIYEDERSILLNKLKDDFLIYLKDSVYNSTIAEIILEVEGIFNKNDPTIVDYEIANNYYMSQAAKILVINNDLTVLNDELKLYNRKLALINSISDEQISGLVKQSNVWDPNKKMCYGGFLFCMGVPGKTDRYTMNYSEIVAAAQLQNEEDIKKYEEGWEELEKNSADGTGKSVKDKMKFMDIF